MMRQAEPLALQMDGKQILVFPGPDASPIVYLHSFEDDHESIREALHEADCPAHTLVFIWGLNWNDDLTPWYCPPLSNNAAPYNGKADEYLAWMENELIPEAEAALPSPPRWRGIAGYSLAGLFAIYALYNSQAFSRSASMSGSLWFPDFRTFATTHDMAFKPDCVFFSLGSKERKAPFKLMRSVQDDTQAIEEHFEQLGIDTIFQLNPGNHYQHVAERTAQGLTWILNR